MDAYPIDLGFKLVSTWDAKTQKSLTEDLALAIKSKDTITARGAMLHKVRLAAEALERAGTAPEATDVYRKKLLTEAAKGTAEAWCEGMKNKLTRIAVELYVEQIIAEAPDENDRAYGVQIAAAGAKLLQDKGKKPADTEAYRNAAVRAAAELEARRCCTQPDKQKGLAKTTVQRRYAYETETRQGVADYVKAAARAGKYIRAGDFMAAQK